MLAYWLDQINSFLWDNAVNTNQKPEDGMAGGSAPREAGHPPLLIALAVLLFAEAALLGAVVIWLVVELVAARPTSYLSAVAILVLVALSAAWVLATAIGTLRGRSWIRGSAVTWQVMQIAIAAGCFQGLYARPDLGWALLVPSIIGILLAISPQVVAATRRAEA
jgi:hypothetical protein